MVTGLPWWRLLRGGNSLLAGAAGGIGGWMIEPACTWQTLLLIAAAPSLITAAGNVQNDLCDIAIDRLNQPDRPLPSGAIPPPTATFAMSLGFALGLASAFSISIPAFAIALGVVLGLTLYNHVLSRAPLWGNLLIAFMGGLPVVYGAVAAGWEFDDRGFVVLSFAAIAFWLHLARELLKDVLDIEGDTRAHRCTIPIVRGRRSAMRLAALAMICGALITLWPAITGWLGAIYLLGVLLTVVPTLLLGAGQCWWRHENTVAATWSLGLKLCMFAGLLWIVLGAAKM